MKLVFLIVLIICFSISDYFIINHKRIVKDSGLCFKGIIPKGIRQIMYFILIPISLFSIVILYSFLYKASIFIIIKHLCVIGFLWSIVISDILEYRIPNKLILLGLIERIVILIFEAIFNFNNLLYTIMNEGIAFVFVLIISVICLLITHGGLGMGDVKLLLIISLFLGIEGMCYSVFLSVFFTFIIAIIFLLTKKKSKKDFLPFAPFVLLGTFVSFILTGV